MLDELTQDIHRLNEKKQKQDGNYQPWNYTTNWNDRRRYARSVNRIKYGIWALRPSEKAWALTLTSSPTKSSLSDLKKDFTYLWKYLRREYPTDTFEYVAIPELTPRRGLFHLHAVIKSTIYLDPEIIRHFWNRIHCAHQIDVHPFNNTPEDLERLSRYCAKHNVKQYGDTKLRCRPLISRGWLPEYTLHVFKNLDRAGTKGAFTWEEINTFKYNYLKGSIS